MSCQLDEPVRVKRWPICNLLNPSVFFQLLFTHSRIHFASQAFGLIETKPRIKLLAPSNLTLLCKRKIMYLHLPQKCLRFSTDRELSCMMCLESFIFLIILPCVPCVNCVCSGVTKKQKSPGKKKQH